MPATSAGLLLYRRTAEGRLEVLLGHMGGPFWARKDQGAWTIPKGEPDAGEDLYHAALREAGEELGVPVPPARDADVPDLGLGEVRQRAGKRVTAWAREIGPDALDLAVLRSNTTEIEWPPRSGRRLEIPEIDRYGWFGLDEARGLVVQAQAAFLDRLEDGARR